MPLAVAVPCLGGSPTTPLAVAASHAIIALLWWSGPLHHMHCTALLWSCTLQPRCFLRVWQALCRLPSVPPQPTPTGPLATWLWGPDAGVGPGGEGCAAALKAVLPPGGLGGVIEVLHLHPEPHPASNPAEPLGPLILVPITLTTEGQRPPGAGEGQKDGGGDDTWDSPDGADLVSAGGSGSVPESGYSGSGSDGSRSSSAGESGRSGGRPPAPAPHSDAPKPSNPTHRRSSSSMPDALEQEVPDQIWIQNPGIQGAWDPSAMPSTPETLEQAHERYSHVFDAAVCGLLQPGLGAVPGEPTLDPPPNGASGRDPDPDPSSGSSRDGPSTSGHAGRTRCPSTPTADAAAAHAQQPAFRPGPTSTCSCAAPTPEQHPNVLMITHGEAVARSVQWVIPWATVFEVKHCGYTMVGRCAAACVAGWVCLAGCMSALVRGCVRGWGGGRVRGCVCGWGGGRVHVWLGVWAAACVAAGWGFGREHACVHACIGGWVGRRVHALPACTRVFVGVA